MTTPTVITIRGIWTSGSDCIVWAGTDAALAWEALVEEVRDCHWERVCIYLWRDGRVVYISRLNLVKDPLGRANACSYKGSPDLGVPDRDEVNWIGPANRAIWQRVSA